MNYWTILSNWWHQVFVANKNINVVDVQGLDGMQDGSFL